MIKLFTDTSANLPLSIIEKHGITVVPFSYSINGKEPEYSEKTDFDGKAFYGAMRNGARISTSMIGVGKYIEYFEKSLQSGDDVIYVGMSGGISGAAHSASIAARELSEKYPERTVCTIDTYAASLGEGLLVLKAAELVEQGRGPAQVEKYILGLRGNMCQYFTVSDLEYLKKGGRILGVTARIGTMLNIKPVLKGDETGHIVMNSKVRGEKKALAELVRKYSELAADKTLDIGIAHGDNEIGATELLGLLRKAGFSGQCLNVCYEPVTGGHVGPGTVALFFFGITK